MVRPPRKTSFVCAGVCSFFHLNNKYNVDHLFIYMAWEPPPVIPRTLVRAHLLNVGHGMIHANGLYHINILTRSRGPRRAGLPRGRGTATERSYNAHAKLFTQLTITITCT